MAKRDWDRERLEISVEEQQAGRLIIELEAQAGIGSLVERAHQGSFLPLGITNPDLGRNAENDSEYDYTRTKVRDAYFGVADVGMRKRLIAAQLASSAVAGKLQALELEQARHELHVARRKSPMTPWFGAAILGVVCTLFGRAYFELAGMVCGAVAGVLIGQGVAMQSRDRLAVRIAEAEARVKEIVRDNAENAIYPSFFIAGEEKDGERSGYWDRMSAQGNRAARNRDAGRSPE